MKVISFTNSTINNLPFGSGIWRDQHIKGFLVICHKSTKTYAVQGDVRRNGRFIRTVRIKIEQWPPIRGLRLDGAEDFRIDN